MYVGQIDTSKQVLFSHRMKNITTLNVIDFHNKGMTVRQTYGIGTGMTLSTENLFSLTSTTQPETGFVLLSDFSIPQVQEGKVLPKRTELCTVHAEDTSKNNLLCTEGGCTAVFNS